MPLLEDPANHLPTVAEVDAVIAVRARPTAGGQGVALLVASTLLFVGAQRTFSDAPMTHIGLLVAVLLLHELGHLVAMRLFGFKDLRMFFIPFFGAAAAGHKLDATGAQRAIVALAGPLSGLVLAFALMFGLAFSEVEVGPTLSEFIGLLLVLNFFNLLPMVPFDGGRFVNLVIFSRWPTAEQLFRLAAGAGMIWLAYALTSWVLGIVGGFVLLGAGLAAKLGQVGQLLRASHPPPRPAAVLDTSPEFRARMIEELAPLIVRPGAPHATTVKLFAMYLRGGWDRAIDAPPGPVASAALLLVYLAFVGVGVALYLKLPADL